jgi:hypothetical protein
MRGQGVATPCGVWGSAPQKEVTKKKLQKRSYKKEVTKKKLQKRSYKKEVTKRS